MDISVYPINCFTEFAEICVESHKTEMKAEEREGVGVGNDSAETVERKDCGEIVDFSFMDPANRN